MRLTPDFELTLRRYVLGGLDEGLRFELEELLLTDPDAFEALGVIEDELVEEYLEGAGPAPERRKLEERFLTSPEHRRTVRLVRALRDRANAGRQPRAEALPARADGVRPAGWRPAWIETLVAWLQPPRWQPAWVAVAAVLAVSLVGNAWLLARHPPPGLARTPAPPTEVAPPGPEGDLAASNRDLQAKLDQERQDRAAAEARAKTLEAQVGRPRTSVATFALASGLLRAQGSLPRIAVPAGTEVVRLRLGLPEEGYPLYRAVLHDPDGNEICAASRLRALGKPGEAAVVLPVPSELLPRGDYQVKLSGLRDGAEPEALATYPFRVGAP